VATTPGTAPHRLALADSDPVRLRGEQHLSLDVAEHYRVRDTGDGWWVEVVSYILEQDGRELIVYHWHPVEGIRSPVRTCMSARTSI
jgi:hypothetical protein